MIGKLLLFSACLMDFWSTIFDFLRLAIHTAFLGSKMTKFIQIYSTLLFGSSKSNTVGRSH